ncbi:MAG TPA: hypothetical protein VK633_05705 [Verrucomicrobiae bacterium]|nr:hypothetical protein [Verrucomicrobiae bacterium]
MPLKLFFKVALVVLLVLFVGCESMRNLNWEMKSEKEQLEPHEQRRQQLYDLSQPQ